MGAGVVICLVRGADLHTAQLMPLPLIVSCFSKIQIGFTFLVPAHPGNPGQKAVKRVCVCLLFIVNCNECLSAEFIGQISVPYKRIGKHFNLINSNNTSSDVLRPIFPNMLLKNFLSVKALKE